MLYQSDNTTIQMYIFLCVSNTLLFCLVGWIEVLESVHRIGVPLNPYSGHKSGTAVSLLNVLHD